jgi:hypothetical protein
MKTSFRLREAVAVGLLVAVIACSDPLAVSIVTLDLDGNVVVSPQELESFRVTAVNRGDDRVVWGSGSSSCQLGLVVLDADGQRHSVDFRDCTSDLVEQGLDPGESLTESFLWGGMILVPQEPWSSLLPMQPLPAGRYRLFGTAGERESEPLWVTVLIP